MKFEVIAIDNFRKEAKHLMRKYHSLRDELKELSNALRANPQMGTPLGKNCFKIRLAIKSKGKGKSGGGRVITCVFVGENRVFLLSIYDKSEMENISDSDLNRLIGQI